MKQRIGRVCGGLLVLLVVLLGVRHTTSLCSNAEEVVGSVSAVTDANHERNYLSERTINTALLPEVSHSLAPSISRTTSGRQRTSASQQSHTPTLGTTTTYGEHSTACRATQSGYLQTSRTKDFYVFALRHIRI